jgi:hypothetical protein
LQILPTDATGKNIFILTDFSLAEKDFDWKQCVDNCTDCARLTKLVVLQQVLKSLHQNTLVDSVSLLADL